MTNTDGIQMRSCQRVGEINRAAWESLRASENLLTDLKFLQALEEAEVLDCKYQYFEFYKKGEILGIMAGYVVFNDITSFVGRVLQSLIFVARRITPNFLRFNTLEFGSPVALGNTFSFSPSASQEDISAIIHLIREYAQGEGIDLILFRDFHQRFIPFETCLQNAGFTSVMSYPVAKLEVGWETFDDYLSALKRRYRYDARKRMKQKERIKIRTVFCKDAAGLAYAGDYTKLYENVRQRSQEFPREFIGEAYHRAMSQYLGDNYYWLQYFQGDRLVAFINFILYRRCLIAQYIGMDYQVSHKAKLYFNALYDLIRFAIEHRIPRVEAGVMTYEAKSAVGFSIHPQWMYLWHEKAAYRFLMPRLFRLFTNFKLKRCHHVFTDAERQTIWDGKSL